jgi:hypothetical protein
MAAVEGTGHHLLLFGAAKSVSAVHSSVVRCGRHSGHISHRPRAKGQGLMKCAPTAGSDNNMPIGRSCSPIRHAGHLRIRFGVTTGLRGDAWRVRARSFTVTVARRARDAVQGLERQTQRQCRCRAHVSRRPKRPKPFGPGLRGHRPPLGRPHPTSSWRCSRWQMQGPPTLRLDSSRIRTRRQLVARVLGKAEGAAG